MKHSSIPPFSFAGGALRHCLTFPSRRHLQRGALLTLAAMALACSTAADYGTSSGGGGGGTGGPPDTTTDDGVDEGSGDGEVQHPPEDGEQCGESVPLGWETGCRASSTLREYTNPIMETVVEIENEFDEFSPVCCEGNPFIGEANSACEDLCVQRLCQKARETHLLWSIEAAPGCWDGVDPFCSFDMEACLSGEAHEQIIDDPDDALDPVDYFLEVSCDAVNTSDRNFDGSFEWIDIPTNNPEDDPPICMAPEEIELAPGARPDSFSASQSTGTYAMLTWNFGGIGGIEATEALSVDLGYRLTPCRNGTSLCFELTTLDLSVSGISAQGLELSNAHLSLEELPTATIEVEAGSFTVPGGALDFRLSAAVDGHLIVLQGTNEGPVTGHLNEEGVTLSGLQLGYQDPLFSATVQIEVESAHYASKPDSTISVLEAPTDCDAPVVFFAATDEPDGEEVSYQWWIPPSTLGSSAAFEAVLSEGSHPVLLMTQDASGRTDATAMHYRRICE